MDVKEFRIGNIVNYQLGVSIYQGVITSLSSDNRMAVDNKLSLKTGNWIGAPLTENILNDAGFKKEHSMDDTFTLGDIGLAIVAGDTNQYQLIIKGKCINRIIKFIHELQNICIDFGKELKIKL